MLQGARGRERCIEAGEIDEGIWTAGQVMGLTHDVPSCKALIECIISEAREAIAGRLASLVD